MIDFKATIKILDYIGVDNFQIDIVPEGIKEKLTLDIEIVKHCECEKFDETNSTICYNGGNYTCGICKCDTNR